MSGVMGGINGGVNPSREGTFEFQREHDGSLSLESAVFQALGAASTCWEDLSTSGVFDSTRAKEIGDKLVEFINNREDRQYLERIRNSIPPGQASPM